MVDVAHSGLTAANLHEPKGAASAAANTVYKATGGGSGAWSAINGVLTVEMNDVSAAETVYLVIPRACTVTKVSSVILNAITVADATVTISNHAGSSMGTITVAFSGSAAGDIDTLTPSSNNTFTAGQRIKLTSDGGSTTTCRTFYTIEYTETA